MTTISANQRTINIINKALQLGFSFENSNSINDIQMDAENFLCDELPAQQVAGEFTIERTGQRLEYSDRMGYTYWSEGDIVDKSKYRNEDPGTLIPIDKFCDSIGNVIEVCYEVPEQN